MRITGLLLAKLVVQLVSGAAGRHPQSAHLVARECEDPEPLARVILVDLPQIRIPTPRHVIEQESPQQSKGIAGVGRYPLLVKPHSLATLATKRAYEKPHVKPTDQRRQTTNARAHTHTLPLNSPTVVLVPVMRVSGMLQRSPLLAEATATTKANPTTARHKRQAIILFFARAVCYGIITLPEGRCNGSGNMDEILP